jgi:hypothetical protein
VFYYCLYLPPDCQHTLMCMEDISLLALYGAINHNNVSREESISKTRNFKGRCKSISINDIIIQCVSFFAL